MVPVKTIRTGIAATGDEEMNLTKLQMRDAIYGRDNEEYIKN